MNRPVHPFALLLGSLLLIAGAFWLALSSGVDPAADQILEETADVASNAKPATPELRNPMPVVARQKQVVTPAQGEAPEQTKPLWKQSP